MIELDDTNEAFKDLQDVIGRIDNCIRNRAYYPEGYVERLLEAALPYLRDHRKSLQDAREPTNPCAVCSKEIVGIHYTTKSHGDIMDGQPICEVCWLRDRLRSMTLELAEKDAPQAAPQDEQIRILHEELQRMRQEMAELGDAHVDLLKVRYELGICEAGLEEQREEAKASRKALEMERYRHAAHVKALAELLVQSSSQVLRLTGALRRYEKSEENES